MSEHSSDGVTKTWMYRYDGHGRRLETDYFGDQNITIQSFYDPEFEYLELGLRIKRKSGKTLWKQYGPDSSGYYGSLNGIGGLEGIIHGKTGDSMGVINDITGNIAAYTYHGEAYFLEGNVDNYGRLTGDAWLPEDAEDIMENAVFWVLKNSRFRGRRVEGNGLSNFGARYYNVETGSFLSSDPYGHDGSLDLYSYASADPVNYVDPDGRLSQPVNEPSGSAWNRMASAFGDAWSQTQMDRDWIMGNRGGPLISEGVRTQAESMVNNRRGSVSFIMNSVPGLSTAMAYGEFKTGQDLITKEPIGKVWAAASLGLSFIPGGSSSKSAIKQGVKGLRPYEVGSFKSLVGKSKVGDRLDIHHVAQKHPAGKVIEGYNPRTAPSIAVPQMEHRKIPTLRGVYEGTPRQLLAKDIADLRKYSGAPNEALIELIDLNKKVYPEAFRK